jgi:hypothetical protein
MTALSTSGVPKGCEIDHRAPAGAGAHRPINAHAKTRGSQR